jgi:hypothetical protein
MNKHKRKLLKVWVEGLEWTWIVIKHKTYKCVDVYVDDKENHLSEIFSFYKKNENEEERN